MPSDARHLGTMLLEEGLLSREQLDRAVETQIASGIPLGRVLVEEGFVVESDLVRTLARQIGIEYVDLSEVQIDPAAVATVPEYLQDRYTVLPIGYEDGRLVCAMADPANVLAIDDLRAVTGLDIITKVATRSDLEDAIRRQSSFDESVSDLADLAAEEEDDIDLGGLEFAAEEAPVVKLLNTLISRAVNERASDIHIEPGEKDLRIRFRIDGVLHEVMRTPRSIANAVVSRVKIMSDLDIAERRLPQDGRIALRVSGKAIDLRTSTLPSIYGEKVVMRILDKSAGVIALVDLGFEQYNLDRFKQAYEKPYGTILVTGPTGSGKTTTLYSTLDILNTDAVNIITVEDPVEYRLAGITQIQVNRKAGLLFATALKSILRADPDIILIGEIRDGETAAIAVESALTGHLVLSTLHTNDAPASIGRLIDMGVEPFLVASAVDCVLAQRLARLLCEKCKVPDDSVTESMLADVEWDEEVHGSSEAFKAVGCATCSMTGFRGRISLNEVMLVNEEIQRLIVERASAEVIKRAAIREGMRTLRDDGYGKISRGLTSFEEILRVVA